MTNPSNNTMRTDPRSWFSRHRHNLVILAIVAVLVVVQWPMLKGMFYRAIGAPYPADNIAWRSGYRAALQESENTGKPVLLDFTASWCPPCQVMKREVWPDPEVGSLIAASYIPVLVDVDDPANQEVAQGYAVATIPAIIIVDSRGSILKKADYLSRDGMVKFLKDTPAERKAL